jgi:hypothetical protein
MMPPPKATARLRPPHEEIHPAQEQSPPSLQPPWGAGRSPASSSRCASPREKIIHSKRRREGPRKRPGMPRFSSASWPTTTTQWPQTTAEVREGAESPLAARACAWLSFHPRAPRTPQPASPVLPRAALGGRTLPHIRLLYDVPGPSGSVCMPPLPERRGHERAPQSSSRREPSEAHEGPQVLAGPVSIFMQKVYP